jgi:copper(I)-binding protein
MTRLGVPLILVVLVVALASQPVATPRTVAATPSILGATPAALVLGETPGAAPVALLIENRGDEADRLLGGSTPIARSVEVHRGILEEGVRVMLPAPQGLVIPGRSVRVLEAERDHLMLVGLREELVQGATFPLTLHLARAGELKVTVRVRRKVDAAGTALPPPARAGDIVVTLASAPPAPAAR